MMSNLVYWPVSNKISCFELVTIPLIVTLYPVNRSFLLGVQHRIVIDSFKLFWYDFIHICTCIEANSNETVS